jgi:coenzyme F420-reducing hydrogenase alpha subunit
MSDLDFRSAWLHQRPQKFDAVLGDRTPIANGSVILGGIEGVKTRLNSERIHIIILALKDALNYGDAGLDLVIQHLENPESQIVDAAYELLESRSEPFVCDAIDRYLDDRELEIQDLKYSDLESSPAASIQKQFKTNKAAKPANAKTNSRSVSKPSKKRWSSAS